MVITVEKYNSLERKGRLFLSNRFLEAFQPELFLNVGFPTRIEEDMEVYKYIDSMHEGRLRQYYQDKNMEYAPTYEEFEIIKKLSKDIYQFSKDAYGRGIIVKAPMLCNMNVLRRIKYIKGTGKTPVIFEIGGAMAY